MSRNEFNVGRTAKAALATLFALLSPLPSQAWTLNYYVVQDQAEPLQIQENGQNHRGIVTEIVQKALAGSDHQLNIHTYPFNRVIAELGQNKDKNWVTYGSPLWGQWQAANLSAEPILEVEHSLLTRRDNPFDYKNPDDLDGKIAVLLFGFNYPGLDNKIAKGSVSEVRVKNYDAAFRVVDRLKNAGGFVEMDLRLKYNLRRLGLSDKDYALQKVNSLIPRYNIHLAYSPGLDSDIQQFMEKRLGEMKANGELDTIINHYR